MDKTFTYIESNKDRYLQELKEFLSFASVSKHSQRKQDTRNCALWLKEHLTKLGMKTQLLETDNHPIVKAELAGQSAKRLMVYGHYDVQPAEPLELWETPPFEATFKEGFIIARGATDDKGQLFCHVKAVEALLATQGSLPCSLLFLIEGEEEGGGDGLKQYVQKAKSELGCEAIIVSDGSMYGENTPAICYGLRGIVSLEIIIHGPKQDLHSGTFGGAVANPALVLSRILAKCMDESGRITIPGIYDQVRQVEPWEKDNLKKLNFDDTRFKQQIGIKETFGEPYFSTPERTWARPTFEVNGIYGGYAGEGGKTIIPSYAGAKITLRLVPDMQAETVCKLVGDYLRSLVPPTVTLEMRGPSGSNPMIVDVDQPIVKAGMEALKAGFGKDPVFIREGGSIPVIKTMWENLHVPVLLMGLGCDSDGAHAPNERFAIDSFIKGIKSSAALLGRYK